MTNQSAWLRSNCKVNFNSTNGTKFLLFKVLVIDRTTALVVNSTWQDGLQVVLKLWACAVLHATFSSRLEEIDCLIGLVRKQG